MVETWKCHAIDHGVAIFPDGKIRPCCQVSASYSKPLDQIANPDRFQDIKQVSRPEACKTCWTREDQGYPSPRGQYKKLYDPSKTGIQFLDVRSSNQCNLKCRYCNPHFSNQWARELEYDITLLRTDFDRYLDQILTDNLREIYWCGGEPLIMAEHYDILESLIKLGISKDIQLRYNTNFTTLHYKDKDIFELWKQFKLVDVWASIDAIGPINDFIRSGSDWQKIESNLDFFLTKQSEFNHIKLKFTPTISILNFWCLEQLFEYANARQIPIDARILYGPDYLSLTAVHSKLKPMAMDQLKKLEPHVPSNVISEIKSQLNREENEYLFNHAVRHILLLDSCRKENLFDFLPFKSLALDITAKNNEYE